MRRLHDGLASRQRELWVDWEGIPPSADWMREVEAAIDAAEAFVFVLSPDSVASPVCQRELAHAVTRNKRLLPVVCRDTEAATVPTELGRLNWIWFRDDDTFDAALGTLLLAVDTDLDWVQAHTRLLVRAVEWDAKSRDSSLTLRGADLAAAELWLALGPTKAPAPTELQTRYIIDSRREANTRRLRLLGAAAVSGVVISVLGTLFVLQRQATAQQEAVAVARRLALASGRVRDEANGADKRADWRQTSLQLAAEAMRQLIANGSRSWEVELSLRTALAGIPHAVEVSPPAMSPSHHFEHIVFAAEWLTATGEDPGVIDHWGAGSLQAKGGRVLGGPVPYRVKAVAISPDGKFVATVDEKRGERVVELWDTQSAAPLVSLPSDGDRVADAAVYPGGTHVVVTTGHRDKLRDVEVNTTRLWRVREPPTVVAQLPGSYQLSFSADGNHLAGITPQPGSDWGQVTVWETVNLFGGNTTPRATLGTGGAPMFSPDGRYLSLHRGPDFVTAEIWRAADWKKVSESKQERSVVPGAAGRFIAVQDAENALVRIIDVATGSERAGVAVPSSDYTAVAFSPDGQRFAVGAGERIDVWRIPADVSGAIASLPAAATGRLRYSADGSQLTLLDRVAADGGAPPAVRIWAPQAAQAPSRHELPAGATTLALSADGRSVAVGLVGKVLVIDAATGVARSAVAVPGRIQAVALSPNARFVAAATEGGKLHLAQTDIPGKLATVDLDSRQAIEEMSVDEDGRQVVVHTVDTRETRRLTPRQGLLVWNGGASPASISSMPGGERNLLDAPVCALSAIGGRAAEFRDGAIMVREPKSGRVLFTLDEARPNPRCAFSADARFLAYTGTGDTLRVWDLTEQAEIARLADGASALDVAFNTGARTIAILHQDGMVRIWPVQYEDLLASACSRLRSNLPEGDWKRYIGAGRRKEACPGLPMPRSPVN